MLFVKTFFHTISRYYGYFFSIAVFLFPVFLLPLVPEPKKNSVYLIFSFLSSWGWFFSTKLRAQQIKVAAGQILQTKIRKIVEKDEGLRNIYISAKERQNESLQLKNQNQKLVKKLFNVRDVFMQIQSDNRKMGEVIAKLKEENQSLQSQLDSSTKKISDQEQENQELKQDLAEALSYQQMLTEEYQATFVEQHSMLDTRQMYIGKLESKVQDLMCEIRNLLQLESNMVDNLPRQITAVSQEIPHQLNAELKKVAFKLENTEAASSLTASRYVRNDLSIHNYSLECRQLFDNLREENIGVLFVYAPKQQRSVFANALFREWLGYGADDFLRAGEEIIVSGLSQWERDLSSPDEQNKMGKIIIKTKHHGQVPFFYCLTKLCKGPLHNHILGSLYPVRMDVFLRDISNRSY